jgi:secretagogin
MIKKIIFYCSDYTANLTTADANGYLQDKDGVYYFDMNKLNKFSLNGIFLK